METKLWSLPYLLFFYYQQCPAFKVLKTEEEKMQQQTFVALLVMLCIVCLCVWGGGRAPNKGLQLPVMTQQVNAASQRLVRNV